MRPALATALAAVLLLACGSGGTASSNDGGTPTPDADGGAPYMPAGYTQVAFLSTTPKRSFSAAAQVLDASKRYVAVMETDAGRIVLELFDQDTPITVNSFVFLSLNRFYEGLAFHRVIDGFMAQSGDPITALGETGVWGTGWPGYYFGLEVKSTLNYDGPGVLGMARASEPATNGSQFFITFVATPSLNQQYTIFGRVAEGLDVLPRIVRGEPPTAPTRIRKVYIGAKMR